MQQTTQEKNSPKERKLLPKLNFKPCNTYLLGRKVEIPETVGSIIIPDTEKWQRRFEVVATSDDLLPHLDHYDVGDILLYPVGAQAMFIQIDDSEYYFLDKRQVISKV